MRLKKLSRPNFVRELVEFCRRTIKRVQLSLASNLVD